MFCKVIMAILFWSVAITIGGNIARLATKFSSKKGMDLISFFVVLFLSAILFWVLFFPCGSCKAKGDVVPEAAAVEQPLPAEESPAEEPAVVEAPAEGAGEIVPAEESSAETAPAESTVEVAPVEEPVVVETPAEEPAQSAPEEEPSTNEESAE